MDPPYSGNTHDDLARGVFNDRANKEGARYSRSANVVIESQSVKSSATLASPDTCQVTTPRRTRTSKHGALVRDRWTQSHEQALGDYEGSCGLETLETLAVHRKTFHS